MQKSMKPRVFVVAWGKCNFYGSSRSMLVVSVKLSYHFHSLILHDTHKMFRLATHHNTALNGNHLVTLKSQNFVYCCHQACRSLDVPTQIVRWMRSLKMWLKSVHFQLFPFLRGISNIYTDPYLSLYMCMQSEHLTLTSGGAWRTQVKSTRRAGTNTITLFHASECADISAYQIRYFQFKFRYLAFFSFSLSPNLSLYMFHGWSRCMCVCSERELACKRTALTTLCQSVITTMADRNRKPVENHLAVSTTTENSSDSKHLSPFCFHSFSHFACVSLLFLFFIHFDILQFGCVWAQNSNNYGNRNKFRRIFGPLQ